MSQIVRNWDVTFAEALRKRVPALATRPTSYLALLIADLRPEIRVAIGVDGGVVQGATANVPMSVTILDEDIFDGNYCSDYSPSDLRAMPNELNLEVEDVAEFQCVKDFKARCELAANKIEEMAREMERRTNHGPLGKNFRALNPDGDVLADKVSVYDAIQVIKKFCESYSVVGFYQSKRFSMISAGEIQFFCSIEPIEEAK